MRIKRSRDLLASSARSVVDAESLNEWVQGPVRAVLPHGAMLCGQSVPHSGGYAAIQAWSFGVPPAYRAKIACAGGNARSPILTRLMHIGGPVFFDEDDERTDFDATWRSNFRLAGWRNVLGLAHREGEGDQLLFTSAAFYNVSSRMEAHGRALQQMVMPHLHAALSRVYQAQTEVESPAATSEPTLAPAERAIVDLLLQGKTNKEIGKRLGRSAETIKHRLSLLMRRLDVRNRTELARLISRNEVGSSGQPPRPTPDE
ncbi:LuxR C-terminal-related transcriptional regulator [Variovorax soli]|uniref:DNA-binding CsgD family transcriptional regulator n=1 Tax=Variovorax soli TaxID=376815 RepID=A0ABU1NGP3_9BURK|nr:LuxR C-terminal-related transcriptional regulator [Variovorax soli]MDR6537206.1 DNA-binding CsgD family transcriptional regulator [Variovorax soli]